MYSRTNINHKRKNVENSENDFIDDVLSDIQEIEDLKEQFEKMELEVETLPISKKGPHEETLSTDILWVGPKDATKLILHKTVNS